MTITTILWIFFFFSSPSNRSSGADDREAFFESRIRPVLAENCYECHSARAKSVKGGLRLDTQGGVAKGGDTGPAVVAGKPEESPLFLAILYQGDAENMPPKGKLPDSVIADFKKWITDGAFDPRTSAGDASPTAEGGWADTFRERLDWWAFRPVKNVRPPDISGVNSPIDAFLLAKLKENGLDFAPEADRPTILRRLHFDLLGLPPTEAEIEAFVNDNSPDAYEKLVDRLLASPYFGERMARRWMDLMRYSETVGSEQDALIPYAWAYRDYLIRAFNADLPYDRLIREHLAGDLISPPRRDPATGLAESPVGTAWTRFVEYYHSPVDVKTEEVVVIDNQVDTLGKTFLGLTIACARCHDHKFDPIGTDDFYKFYGTMRTARATVHTLADPAELKPVVESVVDARKTLRSAIAESWKSDLEKIQATLGAEFVPGKPGDPKTAEFWKQSGDSQKWAFAFAMAREALVSGSDWKKAWKDAWSEVESEGLASWMSPNSKQTLIADFTQDTVPERWSLRALFTPQHSPAGTFRVGSNPKSIVEAVRPSGFYSDTISEKLGATLRSPEFTLTDGTYSALVSGTAGARLRLVVENFQGVDILFAGVTPVLNEPRPTWVKLPVREIWKGRQAYLELVTRDDMPSTGVIRDLNQLPRDGRSSAGIRYVVHHPNGETAHESSAASAFAETLRYKVGADADPKALAEILHAVMSDAVRAFESDTMTDAQTAVIQSMLDHGFLTNTVAGNPQSATAAASFRSVEEAIDLSARSVGAADDAHSTMPQKIFLRGDHRRTGADAPPGDLALTRAETVFPSDRPARLALADALTREDHPLVARVMVNRLWSYFFGKGLFATEDNLGRLGEEPSHPELLDYLATEFRRNDLSIKRMARAIVTTRAYRQSSLGTEKAAATDPTNRLLSHASLRRLDAESLRDAVLTASGRLDRTLYGLPVPTPQPRGLTDDKKPVSGPVDGAGRRSIYLNVRKNFPVEFLEVFDRPRPTLPVGRRNVSNQPAQALALLNDPFIKGESVRLATLLDGSISMNDSQRVRTIYLRAFGREPNAGEVDRAIAFVRAGGGWADLAHAVFCMKEFLYLK